MYVRSAAGYPLRRRLPGSSRRATGFMTPGSISAAATKPHRAAYRARVQVTVTETAVLRTTVGLVVRAVIRNGTVLRGVETPAWTRSVALG